MYLLVLHCNFYHLSYSTSECFYFILFLMIVFCVILCVSSQCFDLVADLGAFHKLHYDTKMNCINCIRCHKDINLFSDVGLDFEGVKKLSACWPDQPHLPIKHLVALPLYWSFSALVLLSPSCTLLWIKVSDKWVNVNGSIWHVNNFSLNDHIWFPQYVITWSDFNNLCIDNLKFFNAFSRLIKHQLQIHPKGFVAYVAYNRYFDSL